MTDQHLSKPDIRQANDCPPLPIGASMLDRMVYWLGLGLGSGLPRRAPGTWDCGRAAYELGFRSFFNLDDFVVFGWCLDLRAYV